MNDLDFTGKTVLVVGGSSGIGNGVAQAFRARGATVAVWGTRDQGDYRKEDGSDLTGLTYARVDVSDSVAVAAAPAPFDSLDILVLAQGTVLYRRGEFEMDGFRKVVGVNLDSLMACAMRFAPDLKASGGNVVTISSTAAYHAARGNPAYAASKAGAVALTATLGQAWATDGVRVNGVAPGLVATKLTRVTTENPDRLAASLKGIPMHRLGTPADMAGAVLFLASPLASYITGQTLIVDGGLTL
ncbi:MAG: SDR family oxidoreductase [Caulobacter sp.]|nr:SDR family oxidoreductase [Caulobacter sp.]MDP1965126.1 SDR family oxidoreductase [Reyranella sp.]